MLTHGYLPASLMQSAIVPILKNRQGDTSDENNYHTSARPEVRGTADVGWRSLFPLPLNPPRTHSRLYHHMCLRTDGQLRTGMDDTDADARCAPFFAV